MILHFAILSPKKANKDARFFNIQNIYQSNHATTFLLYWGDYYAHIYLVYVPLDYEKNYYNGGELQGN